MESPKSGLLTDSCVEEEEDEVDGSHLRGEEDYTSLAFERDLERLRPEERARSHVSSDRDEEKMHFLEEELYRLQEDLAMTSQENCRYRQELQDRDALIREQREALEQLSTERDTLRRQVEDIKTTVEYQEAMMDRAGEDGGNGTTGSSTVSSFASNSNGRSSSERRSLRRKRHDKHAIAAKAAAANNNGEAASAKVSSFTFLKP